MVVSNSSLGARPKQGKQGRGARRHHSEGDPAGLKKGGRDQQFQQDTPPRRVRSRNSEHQQEHRSRHDSAAETAGSSSKEPQLVVQRGQFNVTLGDSPPSFEVKTPPKKGKSKSRAHSVSTPGPSPPSRKNYGKSKKLSSPEKKKKEKRRKKLTAFLEDLMDEVENLDETIDELVHEIKADSKFVSKCKKNNHMDKETLQLYRDTLRVMKRRKGTKNNLVKNRNILDECVTVMMLITEDDEDDEEEDPDYKDFQRRLEKEVIRADEGVTKLRDELRRDNAFIDWCEKATEEEFTDVMKERLRITEDDLELKEEELVDREETFDLLKECFDYLLAESAD